MDVREYPNYTGDRKLASSLTRRIREYWRSRGYAIDIEATPERHGQDEIWVIRSKTPLWQLNPDKPGPLWNR